MSITCIARSATGITLKYPALQTSVFPWLQAASNGSYRPFGTAYRSHLQESSSPKKNTHSTLRNIPEERRSHLHRGGSLTPSNPAFLEKLQVSNLINKMAGIYWTWSSMSLFRRSRHSLWITNLMHNSFFYICLFQFSACFEQPSAHHQESQLYQYDLWYMSLCAGDRVVCRFRWNCIDRKSVV